MTERKFLLKDLFQTQYMWKSEIEAIHHEVMEGLEETAYSLEEVHTKPQQKMLLSFQNQLLGFNMKIEKLLQDFEDFRYATEKYSLDFPLSPSNSCYKQHVRFHYTVENIKRSYLFLDRQRKKLLQKNTEPTVLRTSA